MSEQVLSILKLCLIAVLYLFFLRVLWAVAVEVRAPELTPRAPRTKKARRKASRERPREVLVIVHPESIAGRSYSVGSELTIGRAPGCKISLEDTYASQLHARIYRKDGIFHVEDLGSTNGTFLNEKQVTSPAVLRNKDRVRIGGTVMEFYA